MLCIKVHESYRYVVALCDSSLIGKKLEEGKRQLEVRESFFKKEEISHETAVKMLKEYALDDATFNIVGSRSIKAALEAGIIAKDGIAYIQEVPFALILI